MLDGVGSLRSILTQHCTAGQLFDDLEARGTEVPRGRRLGVDEAVLDRGGYYAATRHAVDELRAHRLPRERRGLLLLQPRLDALALVDLAVLGDDGLDHEAVRDGAGHGREHGLGELVGFVLVARPLRALLGRRLGRRLAALALRFARHAVARAFP